MAEERPSVTGVAGASVKWEGKGLWAHADDTTSIERCWVSVRAAARSQILACIVEIIFV